MQANQAPKGEIAITCNLNAIPAAQREHHGTLALSLFAAVQEMKSLPSGYTFRLPATSEMILKAAEYIANERLCCPFFNFNLEIAAGGNSIWLALTGGARVRDFIKAEFPAILDPDIIEAAGL
jgi:hypothetical protein